MVVKETNINSQTTVVLSEEEMKALHCLTIHGVQYLMDQLKLCTTISDFRDNEDALKDFFENSVKDKMGKILNNIKTAKKALAQASPKIN